MDKTDHFSMHQLNKGTVNITSSAEFIEMGNAPSFFDNLVQVEAAS